MNKYLPKVFHIYSEVSLNSHLIQKHFLLNFDNTYFVFLQNICFMTETFDLNVLKILSDIIQ